MRDSEEARFWRAGGVPDLELLSARYVNHRFAPHAHDSFVFAVIESGVERFRYRGQDHYADAGTIALLNPDEVHTGERGDDSGWRYRVFYPSASAILGVFEELGYRTGTMPAFEGCLRQDGDACTMLLRLHRLFETNASVLQQQTAWRDVLLCLFQRYARLPSPRSPGHEPAAVTRAKERLSASLSDPPSLDALAAEVGLSAFHFSRVFRRTVGMPPYAWLCQRRLEQAKVLLRAGCLPLEVAALLGFSDQSHLTRQFKRAYGVAPGEYRSATAV
ncbi:AraC family transcriptional regulator [Pseudomonas sp. Marseille-QA0892]